ncbi:MAG: ADP-glyceromanno-heptose 6-epimerase [Chitinophagaceae bacterium]|jgi:ADP-L-glycero-D-manno-heptose 6-epimerase|nr:ADP-glyceromanno-heptose 6-epimerase [Chitinophagaceae bacterium]MBK7679084.1 ADP-glyceromanno-heptose 6-epimerase [Chitinophagaceae bacterium]MBK8299571.1 ADP-glyceromanno-heptose 6-epimerase [Chitinophagaceae bacterium]MBK9463621.1 ADP-glyceromanno-heptose 6-epimerase [Chitinophagaceae bacterium]MBK9659258.1 ADP-glyceromanno-heptose 6-epimerase [Chitinophagaceae bacterium]
MNKNSFILLTGAAGFIGSYLLGYLNKQGYNKIIIVDDFTDEDKWFNLSNKKFITKVERDELFDWLRSADPKIEFVYHLGARTDTTEFDYSIHQKLNVEYSKSIWNYCTEKNIPLVYASSAATYGNGEFGYKDNHDIVGELKPLNPYGVSKNEFDKWALQQTSQPPFWAGLKFFNVYGPNEYHKDRMASMIFHGYNQIKKTGKVKLFKSHKPEFRDGEQLRDFIYVEDVANVCYWLIENRVESGLYNLGTGKARPFKDLVTAIFTSLNREPQIEFIDMPEDIRDKYQYFTEADMNKLKEAGYNEKFFSLENGVQDYVKKYLLRNEYY